MPNEELVKAIKITGVCNQPDDPSYPFKLEANLRPPEFMSVAFIGLYGGSEEIVLRGKTKEAFDAFIAANDLRTHPRLRWMKITGPDGVIEEVKGR